MNSAGLDVDDRRGDRGDGRARAPGPARRATSSRRRPASRSPTCATSGDGRSQGRRSRGRRLADRLHRRPRLRAVDPGRERGHGLGRADRGRRGVRHPAGRDARPRRRPARGRPDPARGRLHVGPPRDEPRAELLARRDRPRPAGRASTRATSSAASRSSARHAPAVRRGGWSACSSTGTTSRACTTRRACRRPSARRSTARRSRSSPAAARSAGRRAIGWSPILKQAIALASVPPQHEALGTNLSVEWTVEGRRGRVGATVVDLPFLDLERKRA